MSQAPRPKAKPNEYDRFEDLTKKLLRVGKTELDKARAAEKAKKPAGLDR